MSEQLQFDFGDPLPANTAITLKCDWDGDFILTAADGTETFFKREDYGKAYAALTSMIRPASGDPK